MRRVPAVLLIATFVLLAMGYFQVQTLAQEPPKTLGKVVPPEYRGLIPEGVKRQLSYISWDRARILAGVLGITDYHGKALSPFSPDLSAAAIPAASDLMGTNVAVGATAKFTEVMPTIAVDPRNAEHLVAGMSVFQPLYATYGSSNSCVAYNSVDGGKTWNGPVTMPLLLDDGSSCLDPVVAFAPDGKRVYYAYTRSLMGFDSNIFAIVVSSDILVSYSDDGGVTWTGPMIAIKGEPTVLPFSPFATATLGFDVDTPSLSVPHEESDSNIVYLTATKYPWALGPRTGGVRHAFQTRIQIVFTRSDSKAIVGSWSAPQVIDITPERPDPNMSNTFVVVQGSKVIGGKSGEVLVSWYNSNGPGIETGVGPTPPDDPIGELANSFIVRTRYSSDYGSNFGPIVNAAVELFEPPEWLGPDTWYQRWVGSRFPDLAIANDGSAHVVYTAGLNADPNSAESGDVHYISSLGPPYESWSVPQTVNDDGLSRAQGLASVQAVGSTLYVTFLDTRLSPDAAPNSIYDVFGAHKDIAAQTWENFRITDASAPEALFQGLIGDRFDLAANDSVVFAIWADRQHLNSGYDWNTDVYGQSYKPIASLASILPATASAGGTSLTLTVNGAGFASNSVVRWDGSDRPTMFVSSNELTALIPAADIAVGSTASVIVYTPGAPGGGLSTAVSFTTTDFSVASAADSTIVTAGQAATYTITVAPTGGVFDRAVSLTCSGLPNLASCSFSPASVTPNGTPVTSALTISTKGATVAMLTPPLGQRNAPLFALWLPFSTLGLVVAGCGTKKKAVLSMLLALLAILLVLSLAGCGSNATPKPATVTQPGTPAGNYTITVSATAGSVVHAGTLTLIVK